MILNSIYAEREKIASANSSLLFIRKQQGLFAGRSGAHTWRHYKQKL
jgi:hypothetical protein